MAEGLADLDQARAVGGHVPEDDHPVAQVGLEGLAEGVVIRERLPVAGDGGEVDVAGPGPRGGQAVLVIEVVGEVAQVIAPAVAVAEGQPRPVAAERLGRHQGQLRVEPVRVEQPLLGGAVEALRFLAALAKPQGRQLGAGAGGIGGEDLGGGFLDVKHGV